MAADPVSLRQHYLVQVLRVHLSLSEPLTRVDLDKETDASIAILPSVMDEADAESLFKSAA